MVKLKEEEMGKVCKKGTKNQKLGYRRGSTKGPAGIWKIKLPRYYLVPKRTRLDGAILTLKVTTDET